MVHRLDHVPDTGGLGTGRVSQVVDGDTFTPNSFQCTREVLTEHLVVEVASATCRREQQPLRVFLNVGVQVVLEVGPDVWRHNDFAALAALGCVDAASPAVRHAPTDGDDLSAGSNVLAAQLDNLTPTRTTPGGRLVPSIAL